MFASCVDCSAYLRLALRFEALLARLDRLSPIISGGEAVMTVGTDPKTGEGDLAGAEDVEGDKLAKEGSSS